MAHDFLIDLDDGLPPAKVETRVKPPKAGSAKPIRFAAPETVRITKVPSAIVICYEPISCLGCGAEHRTHLGIFLESRVGHGRILERRHLRDLPAYAGLPRRVDVGPRSATPVCIDCWMVQSTFEQAIDVALMADAEGIDFGRPEAPAPMAEIAAAVREMAEREPGELPIIDPEEENLQ